MQVDLAVSVQAPPLACPLLAALFLPNGFEAGPLEALRIESLSRSLHVVPAFAGTLQHLILPELPWTSAYCPAQHCVAPHRIGGERSPLRGADCTVLYCKLGGSFVVPEKSRHAHPDSSNPANVCCACCPDPITAATCMAMHKKFHIRPGGHRASTLLRAFCCNAWYSRPGRHCELRGAFPGILFNCRAPRELSVSDN